MSVLKIPVWPEEGENHPMTFLHGEPGWYLWMQHRLPTELNQIERDLMLLYNNGDLKDFPAELSPESGIYVCTFTENKVLRGLILNKFKNVAPEEGSVIILDVDSGKVLTVPKNNLKVLPTFACKAPAGAVRCDLGLDCKERCDWPPLLDEMLKRALCDAQILVTLESERPGTIPTVSVTARLWNPIVGSAIDLRVWFAQHFRPLLEISSLNGYLPEPLFNNKGSEPQIEFKPEDPSESCVAPDLLRTNSWNSFNGPFAPNMMPPLVNPPPGFVPPSSFYPQAINTLTALLLNQGLYPPLPWTQMWPNMTADYVPSNMNLTPPPPPPQYFPQYSPQPLPRPPQSLPSSELSSLPSSVPSSLAHSRPPSASLSFPSLPKGGNFVKVGNTPNPFNAEDRSSSPVLTLESLLEGSPTLKRKPIEKEVTTPLTVDSLLGSPSNVRSTPKSIQRSPGPKTKVQPKAAKSFNHESNGHNHVVLQEIQRDWSVGEVVHVIMSNVISPELFAANVVDCHALDFNLLQQEMNNYKESLPLSVSSKEEMFAIVGNFCASYDDKDKTWFRAEILDWHFDDPDRPIQAWSVDFGGMYEVPLTKIHRLEGYPAKAPMQCTLFGMHNVRPRRQLFENEWPEEHCAEVRKMMPVDSQFWLQIEKPATDALWPVSVFKDRNCLPPSLNTTLVDKKLAFYHNSLPDPNQPSGWTQEQEMVYTSAFNDLDLPDEGSVFTLKISKIMNVHHFFGIRIPDIVSSKEEHYKMLLTQINTPEEVRKFELCRTAPAFGQLVLARDSSKGYWFRARVIDVAHDCEDRFEVRNVDTGIMRGVELKNMREMNPAFLHLPLQAIECFLADVVPVLKGREFSNEGCALVDSLVRNETVKAYVVSKSIEDALEVKVTVNCDGERQDLATILLRKGFVRAGPKRVSVPYKEVIKYRPG